MQYILGDSLYGWVTVWGQFLASETVFGQILYPRSV